MRLKLPKLFRKSKRRKRRTRRTRKPLRPQAPPSQTQKPKPKTTSLETAGDLMLKQRIEADGVVKEIYVQPVRMEAPNMVTVGGKLDTIITKLDQKPDREWFANEYLNTLKEVAKLSDTAVATSAATKPAGDRSRLVQNMEEEAQQRLNRVAQIVTPNLILKTLQEGTMTITDLQGTIEVSRPTLWKHLKRLEKEGKVSFKRQGNFKFVSLCQPTS